MISFLGLYANWRLFSSGQFSPLATLKAGGAGLANGTHYTLSEVIACEMDAVFLVRLTPSASSLKIQQRLGQADVRGAAPGRNR